MRSVDPGKLNFRWAILVLSKSEGGQSIAEGASLKLPPPVSLPGAFGQ
jgi:hypothetical protein